jgi:hypothetical protein
MEGHGNSKGIAGAVASAGGLILIGFFLPVVDACGMRLSGPDLANESAEYWLYAVVGAVVVVLGLVGLAQVGVLRLAALLATGALAHLLFRTLQASQDDDLGVLSPLVGYYVILAGLLVAAIAPWFARVSAARGGPPGDDEIWDPEDEP